MQTMRSLVGAVEQAVASGEEARRVKMLREVTGLFLAQAANLDESQVEVFDEVIGRLARELEFRARVELAEQLADIENAPRVTVRDLAFDEDIRIARPVLERSVRLAESDLVSIAQARGQDHLMALSGRPHLPERVTDVIVERGDSRVVRRVASNNSARFSPLGFDTLVRKAEEDDHLVAILGKRADVPVQLAETVMQQAKRLAHKGLTESGDLRSELVAAVLEASAEALQGEGGSAALICDFRGAEVAIKALAESNRLNEEELVAMLEGGRLAEVIVGLARLANVPVAVAQKAYTAPDYDPLLFMARAIRLSWPTFRLLLAAKAGKELPQGLIRDAFHSYENLSTATAQRVLRFVAAKERAIRT